MADDQAYGGQAQAGSDTNPFNAQSFFVESIIANQVRTGQPVKIVKAPYDKDGNPIARGSPAPVGYVDVLPLVNQLDGNGNAVPHMTVHRLSYYRYQGGGFAIITDPVVGDIGQMVISDRDTSGVRATNDQANPGSGRKFDMADGTYFGNTQGGAPSAYVSYDGNNINIVVPSGKNVAITGNLTVTGEITAKFGTGNPVTVSQHIHPDPQGGNTGLPQG